jgi:lipopolysaccharide transport system permease protein
VAGPVCYSGPMFGVDAFRVPWRHRRLVLQLARREVAARYRGSFLGIAWAFALPLATLGVYTFAFGQVLGRHDALAEAGHPVPFVLFLFTGLLLFHIVAELVQSSPNLIRSNAVYVKQVIFPLEILPIVALLAALFNALVSAAMLLVFHIALIGLPPASALWLPIVAAPVVLLAGGLGWALAAVGAYFRDLTQVVGLVTTGLLFLSPIFYGLDAVPEGIRTVLSMNPIATVVTAARSVLFLGTAPDFLGIAASLAACALVFALGFELFRWLRPHFADVV